MITNPTQSTWSESIDDWSTAMKARRLSPDTISLRRYHLTRLSKDVSADSPWALTGSDLLEWTGSHVWSRETARAVRSSLRKFWEWGVISGRTEVNSAVALPPIRPAEPSPRPATPAVVSSAISSASGRVKLMVRLANEMGMRRGEVARVSPEVDLVKELGGWSLIVHGKGSKNRVLPLPVDLAQSLQAVPTGYLFPNGRGSHLTPHWVGTLVSRALADGTTMHQLRHLCATEIHNETHDVRLVQTLLGHASLATTQRYIAVDDTKVREALAARSRRWSKS